LTSRLESKVGEFAAIGGSEIKFSTYFFREKNFLKAREVGTRRCYIWKRKAIELGIGTLGLRGGGEPDCKNWKVQDAAWLSVKQGRQK